MLGHFEEAILGSSSMEMVRIKKARKEYGALVAVDDVDWTIEKGEVWGLIGPNGAGKTTLMKLIATLHTPTSGRVAVMGHDVLSDKQKVRAHLGYMPDFFTLYDGLTLDDCVRYFGRCYKVPEAELDQRVASALSYVGLSEKRFELISHLSRGMTQRLGIANLLVHDPALILLDEPASGLDPHSRIQLRNVLKRLASEGKTIIISSHILTELEQLVTHVCAMHRGRMLACGELKQIRRQMASSQAYVELVPGSSDPQAAAAVLDQVDGISGVRVEGTTLFFAAEDGARTVSEVNRALVNQKFSVCAMGQKEEGLESLFLQLTGEPDH
jgi:ABC-2 type transport system ATP-binding protein